MLHYTLPIKNFVTTAFWYKTLYKTLHTVFVVIISSHFSILEMNRIAYHLFLSILLQSLWHRCPCVQLSYLACYHPILVWHGKALQSMSSVLSPVLRGSSWRSVPANLSERFTFIWKENICWRKTLSIRPFSAEAYCYENAMTMMTKMAAMM